MLNSIQSIKIIGSEAVPVKVECSIDEGDIGIHLVGLVEAAVSESLRRMDKAIKRLNYRIPGKRIVFNLAPADLKKSASGYDLPMVLAFLAASEQVNLPDIEKWMALGELGVDGSVRDVPGAYQATIAAVKAGCKGCIIPIGDLPSIIRLLDDDAKVYPVSTLSEAIEVVAHPEQALTAKQYYEERTASHPEILLSLRPRTVWDRIKGNEGAKRAVEIAAAGGHPLLLVGAPGSSKELIARALWNLLPPLSESEAKEVCAIHSFGNRGGRHYNDAFIPPFCEQDNFASISSLFGGGQDGNIMPGKVSLAHKGVLFFNNLALTPKSVLETLRVPLEDKQVTIPRRKSRTVFPADFRLVAAAEPCPCGYYGEGDRCTCTAGQRAAYLEKLSGPIYERLTIQAYCHIPAPGAKHPKGEGFQKVYGRVQNAIAIQKQRFANEPYKTNDEIPAKDIEKYCPLSGECKDLLEMIFTRLGLSARAYTRIIRIARTIADLAGSDSIKNEHIAEAASFRFLDRKNILDEILTAEHQAS